MRVGEKKIRVDSARVQETESDTRTRKERRKSRETEATTNATDEIGAGAAVAALRDPSTTADRKLDDYSRVRADKPHY